MGFSTLSDLINSLSACTNLHIGAVFLGGYGNQQCILPHKNMIHASMVCEHFKDEEGGYERCFRCRNYAIKRAIKSKKPFGKECINGVYEYTHPIVENGKVVCIVYIGNILPKNNNKISNKISKKEMLNTMQVGFTPEDCKKMAFLIESYIKMLLMVYPKQNTYNPLAENFKAFIESNLEYQIGVKELAEMFHYNKKYLGRLFYKEVGKSVNEFICERRIERAKELLHNRELTITQVALKVGVENITYFNRIFKKLCGVTPSAYRKQQNAQK